MKKYLTCCLLFIFLGHTSFSQKDTTVLSREETKELMKQINFDTVRLLRGVSTDACKCIDSIRLINKDDKEVVTDITACISKQTLLYESMMQVNRSMKEGNLNILINMDKESGEYKEYYYRIEEWLMDSCTSLKNAVAANNKESELSISKNSKAIDQYNKGMNKFKEGNYKDALPWFEKAVKTDPAFAFAWDNIGICNRNLNNFDKALEAYNKSLELDPKGKTPLQNIPVVYEYQKEYDKAIEAYLTLSKIYPDDPEAFYGIGRMYEMKNDLEKALDYMCKAYNAYITINSPFRSDAQNNINIYYRRLKNEGKEELFFKILKDNHISTK